MVLTFISWLNLYVVSSFFEIVQVTLVRLAAERVFPNIYDCNINLGMIVKKF